MTHGRWVALNLQRGLLLLSEQLRVDRGDRLFGVIADKDDDCRFTEVQLLLDFDAKEEVSL